MSKFLATVGTAVVNAGINDGTTLGTSGYAVLQGGSATQYVKVNSILLTGQATTSSVNLHLWARDSTLGTAPSALVSPNSNGPKDANTAALAAPAVFYVACPTTGPTRSNSITLAKLNLSFNSFGGILFWQTAPGDEWGIYGSAVNTGESSLSTFPTSGTGAIGISINYEVA
jgi:hypothetical protein